MVMGFRTQVAEVASVKSNPSPFGTRAEEEMGAKAVVRQPCVPFLFYFFGHTVRHVRS